MKQKRQLTIGILMRKLKNVRWYLLIIGISCIDLGTFIYEYSEWTTLYGITFDVGSYRIPFAGATIAIGIYAIWVALTSKRHEGYLMCAQCEKPFEESEVDKNRCPICQNNLEPMSEFYKRHPELKNKEKR